MLYSALINVMVKAARRAGRSLKRDFGEVEHLQVSEKGPADFVSHADTRPRKSLYEELAKARPGYGFLGEEGGSPRAPTRATPGSSTRSDGTTNFLHGIPHFAISIGLQREGAIMAGVIYNPTNDELFWAEKGKGAFVNDQRLRVAGRRQPRRMRARLRHPAYRPRRSSSFGPRDGRDQSRVAGVRRFGAASLDLAFVAAGRFDGYWERNLQPWDIAAGQIMVREAGGTISGMEGSDDPLKTGHVICGNEFVHGELVKILKPLDK